eukprot:m.152743 g.152743  ORF g.152743 m.152743 type:complete len:1263 (-) comp15056_c0_seq1:1412-5200(-)
MAASDLNMLSKYKKATQRSAGASDRFGFNASTNYKEETAKVKDIFSTADNLESKLDRVFSSLVDKEPSKNSSLKKLAYLNEIVSELIAFQQSRPNPNDVVVLPHFIRGVRMALSDELMEVRAAGFRLLRYFSLCFDGVIPFLLEHKIDTLLIPALEAETKGENERYVTFKSEQLQAYKLLRLIIGKHPSLVPKSLVLSVIAIAKSSDPYKLIALESLCELALSDLKKVATLGGIEVISNAILEAESKAVCLALINVLVELDRNPECKQFCSLDSCFFGLIIPFADPFSCNRECSQREISGKEEKDLVLNASSRSIEISLKMWRGIFSFSGPNRGIEYLVKVLYMESDDESVLSHNTILALIFNVFDLDLAPWVESLSTIFSWAKLIQEKKMAKKRLEPPSILSVPKAVVLRAFLDAGLLDALVELATVHWHLKLRVRAAYLLGAIKDLSEQLLPSNTEALDAQCRLQARLSSSTSPTSTCWIREVVRFLQSYSVFSNEKRQSSKGAGDGQTVTHQVILDDVSFEQLITKSKVLSTGCKNWQKPILFDLVQQETFFKPSRLHSASKFFARILRFFCPGSREFCNIPLNDKYAEEYGQFGRSLLAQLVKSEEGCKLVQSSQLFYEIAVEIQSVASQRGSLLSSVPHGGDHGGDGAAAPFDELCARHYVSFIGTIASSNGGARLLTQSGCFSELKKVLGVHGFEKLSDVMFKSISFTTQRENVSELERTIADKIAYSGDDLIRKRCLQRVFELVSRHRAPRRNKWILNVLCTALASEKNETASLALKSLRVACDNPSSLSFVAKMNPTGNHIGDLQLKYFSIPKYIGGGSRSQKLKTLLQEWTDRKCLEYVNVLEDQLQKRLFPHEEHESDPSCFLTNSNTSGGLVAKKRFVPPIHLFSEVCETKPGAELLGKQQVPMITYRMLSAAVKHDPNMEHAETDIQAVKAALWALGHIGSKEHGIRLLQRPAISLICSLALKSVNTSVRGTSLFALSLLSRTQHGKQELRNLGWACTQGNSEYCSVAVPMNVSQLYLRGMITENPSYVDDVDISTSSSSEMWLLNKGNPVLDTLESEVTKLCRAQENTTSNDDLETAKLHDTVLRCTECLGNGILRTKVGQMIVRLRGHYRNAMSTVDFYLKIRNIIDNGEFDLEVRRLLMSLFQNKKTHNLTCAQEITWPDDPDGVATEFFPVSTQERRPSTRMRNSRGGDNKILDDIEESDQLVMLWHFDSPKTYFQERLEDLAMAKRLAMEEEEERATVQIERVEV